MCPLCGSAMLSLFSEHVILGTRVRNILCENCTLVFQSPRLSEDELNAYYAGPYWIQAIGAEVPIASKLDFEQARALHLADVIEQSIGTCKVHLDIGCAAAALLLETKRRFGCHVVGIEPGVAYAAHARQAGVEIHSSLDEFLKQMTGGGRPDIVTMSHVLEHVSDPVSFLRRIRDEVLPFDGYLLIEVPNLFVHTAFEPAHLFAYHEGTLEATLGAAGFEVSAKSLHNKPRSDPRPHYLLVIATPGPTRPIRRVRFPKLIRIKRAYARSSLALAVHHPVFVTHRALHRLAGG